MRTPALRFAALAVALVLSAASARAIEPEEPSIYARNGFYLAATASYLFNNFSLDDIEDDYPLGNLKSDDVISATGRFGYRLHPRWSVEAQGDWLNRFTIRDGSSKVAEVEGGMFTANGRFHFMTGRFQPYALAGVGGGFVNVKRKVTAFDLDEQSAGVVTRFGAGFDFYFSDGFGALVDANYVLPFMDIEDYDYISLNWGIFLRF